MEIKEENKINTFLPYANFQKSAQCLDYKRLGKQRVEAWQIYNTLVKGEYSVCPDCDFGALIDKSKDIFDICPKCKGTGKIKTAWYNHPIVKMWKGYENALLWYGVFICREWIERGYKDTLYDKFMDIICNNKIMPSKIIYPSWLGNKKFHSSMRSNLLRKDKKHYSKFGWKEKDNLPYYWIKEN